MHWIAHLEGGPRRVNHAAVALSPMRIYSFGGYCSGGIEASEPNSNTKQPPAASDQWQPIDIHVLNIESLSWKQMPAANNQQPSQQVQKPQRKNREQHNVAAVGHVSPPLPSPFMKLGRSRASTIVAPLNFNLQQAEPEPMGRPRTRSVAELHPLAQLRLFRPPLADGDRVGLPGAAIDDTEALERSEERSEMEVEDEAIDPLHSEQGIASLQSVTTSDDSEDEEEDGDRKVKSRGVDRPQPPASKNIGEEGTKEKGMESSGIPCQRYGHTVVAYKGKAYLWGGRSDELGYSALLHEYDPGTNSWSIVPVGAGSIVPPARDGHTACIYGDTMVVFGGYEELQHRFSQECYAFSFTTREWTMLSGVSSTSLPTSKSSPPQHRDYHTAVVIDSRMYVFGGRCDKRGEIYSGQDFYCPRLKAFDLERLEWIDLTETMKGDVPTGRRSHSAWTHAGRMYIFGGYHSTSDRHFNELYQYCPTRNEWRLLSPSGIGPAPRRRQCTVAIGDRVYLFGGSMPNMTLSATHRGDNHHSGIRCGVREEGPMAPSATGHRTDDGRLLETADLYVLEMVDKAPH